MKRQTRQMLATLWLLGLCLLGGLSGMAQAQVITITSPVAGAVFAPSTTLTVEATADTSYGGWVSRIEFYQNNTLIGMSTGPSDRTPGMTVVPYSVTWSNVPPGSYTLRAKAFGSFGNRYTSRVPIVVGAVPTVSLTSPAANARVETSGTVTLEASAADIDGTISKVEFYRSNSPTSMSGTRIGTATTAPYRATWSNMPQGYYYLTARATDNDGIVKTSAVVPILVDNAPTVSLTAPVANTVVADLATLSLTASAADTDGSVSKVEFYQNDILIGTSTTAPYGVTWYKPPLGSYVLTAKATDNDGITTTSAGAPIKVAAAPTVSLTAPAVNAVFKAPATVTLDANAADADGTISKVEFYQNNTLIGTATTAPYRVTWNNVPRGSYSLTVKATDNDGITTSSPSGMRILVYPAPTVSLTAPVANAVFNMPAMITLTATAADTRTGVRQVDFYQGSTLLGSRTSAPYQFNWYNAPAGSYSLTAIATNRAGITETSVAVPITVNATPTISLSSPAVNAVFNAPASITVTANAADSDGTINKVDFYQGTTLIGTATAAPYSATWSNVPVGNYSLTAKATDDKGGVTLSAAVPIEVKIGNWSVYYLHTDHLNTPRLVTDEQKRIVWRNLALTEPFGNSPPEEDPDGDGQNFSLNLRFPGQYFDKESNLNYNYYRDYDPTTGRYIQSDPIGLAGGINTYAYVGGNPVGNVDPEGLLFMSTLGGLQRGTTLDEATSYGLPGNVAAAVGLETAAAAGVAYVCGSRIAVPIAKDILRGREYTRGKDLRIAPWGNRTGHPIGRWPHYHRRGTDGQGNTIPGQGIGRHRPWESKSTDKCTCDRF